MRIYDQRQWFFYQWPMSHGPCDRGSIGPIGNSFSETLCLSYNNIDLKHQKFIELGTGFDNFLDSDYVKT